MIEQDDRYKIFETIFQKNNKQSKILSNMCTTIFFFESNIQEIEKSMIKICHGKKFINI